MIRVILLAILGFAVAGNVPVRKLASTGPSDDPIGVTPPNFPGGAVAVDAPPGPFFQDMQPPFPTDAWWSGFTVSNQNANVAGPFPFQCQTTNTGLNFGISDVREFDGTSVHQRSKLEWLASFSGLPDVITNRKATSFDTQTVCLRYFNGPAVAMDTCLVPGSPYMTFTYTNAAVLLTSMQGEITDFTWVTPGSKAKVTNQGGTYIIYVTEGNLNLAQVGLNTLTSTPGFSGTIRMAKLKEAGQEAVLDAHSGSIPTGVTMSYTVAGDVSTQVWTWDVIGNAANLLLLNWPHHRKVLQNPTTVAIEYMTIKGPMKGILGNTWTQRHALPTISWFAENPVQASCLPELTRTLEVEIAQLEVMVPGDFYFWGGAFGRAAQMATIAEHINRPDLRATIVEILKASIEYWFMPGRRPAAAFETGWGGFINGDGWNNTWVDFGNAYYNDHHFHYGYLMHGAAVIGKADPAWLAQHLDFLIHVARDYANPSPNDPHYTVTRHMDFFAGHSWASGIANGAGPRDQESSGEAINGYYGVLLFAHVINNQALIDYSRLLLAMEVAGARSYWHMYPKMNDPDSPYPEQGLRDLVTIGNVMDTQAGAWLFWGADTTQIAAIQILPLTPMGQYNYDVAWMEEVLLYCKAEIDDPKFDDAFKSVILAAYAVVNPQSAFAYSQELSNWGSGNSATNQLYFIATQNSPTPICSAGAATPEGVFTIQDVATGKFVSLTGAAGHLTATTGADVLATKFQLAFTPGGSTIQALSNAKFVTASPDGAGPLSAVRDSPQSFETFRWSAVGGNYELVAMVNRGKVSTNAAGELVNIGVGSTYKLVESDNSNPGPIPASGVLKNVQTGLYVVSSAANPTLMVSGSVGEASRFSFERVATSPDAAPTYGIRSVATEKIVTGDAAGATPLAAIRDTVSAWEEFRVVANGPSFIIIHTASGMAAAVQPDGTVIDNNSDIGGVAQWVIE